MAKDKITYNDELKRLQLGDREEIEKKINGLVNYTEREIRNSQLEKLYSCYLDNRFSSTRSFMPGQETSQTTLQQIFKNNVIVNPKDAEVAHTLAEMTERGKELSNIAMIMDEVRCAKMCIEDKTGVTIPIMDFLKNTDVLENAELVARLRVNSKYGFSDPRLIPPEFWGKIKPGEPFNFEDMFPMEVPPKSFFAKLVGALQSLSKEKTLGDTVIEEDNQK